MTAASVLDSHQAIGGIRAEWDRLAVDAERPFCTPDWMLPWWDHLRPAESRLRVIAVRSEDRLVGVFPLYAVSGDFFLLGAGICPVEPIAVSGMEEKVAAAAAEALAAAEPELEKLSLWAQDDSPDWSHLLGDAWPSGGDAWQRIAAEARMPKVTLGDDGFDGWMRSRDRRFRGEVRRRFRRLDDKGAEFRFSTEETLGPDIDEMLRLHRGRLDPRGGTSLGDEGIEMLLREAGEKLVGTGRFRLLCLEMDGKVVAAQLLLAAGSRATGWVGGFDDEYRRYAPAVQCIVHALKDSAERGERTISLGPGRQGYKYQLATGDGSFTSSVVVPPGKLRARGREYAGAVTGALRLALRERRQWVAAKLGRGPNRD